MTYHLTPDSTDAQIDKAVKQGRKYIPALTRELLRDMLINMKRYGSGCPFEMQAGSAENEPFIVLHAVDPATSASKSRRLS